MDRSKIEVRRIPKQVRAAVDSNALFIDDLNPERILITVEAMGYATEYHVERLMREVLVNRIGPVTEQLILCFIAEKVLDLPKSY